MALVDKKNFFTKEFQLANMERMTKTKIHHFITPKEITGLSNSHLCVRPLARGWRRKVIMEAVAT